MLIPLAFFVFFSGSGSVIGPVVMFLMGALMFFLGFRSFRRYRLLADTPVIPVRSAPMGLVHISGKSTGGEPLTSPLMRVPCYYYKVVTEREEDKGGDNGGTEWKTISTDFAEVPFHLEDATGRILVNPRQAEYDVTRAFYGEVRGKSLISIGHASRKVDESLGLPAPAEEHLRAYLTGRIYPSAEALNAAHVPGAKTIGKVVQFAQKLQSLEIGSGNLGSRPYRLTEHCLPAGRACNVMGTCVENPTPADERDRNLIKRGENEKTFLITTKTEKQIEKSLRLQAFFLVLIGGVLMVGAFAFALYAK